MHRTAGAGPAHRLGRPASARSAVALLAVALLAAITVWLPGSAYAVTPVASEPRARQQLDDPPGAVTLAFAGEVDPSVAKIIVTGPDGDNVTDGALIVEGTNVTSQLQDGLGKGTYTVHYRISRADGEPEGGAFQFSYGKGSFTTLPDRSWSGEKNEPQVLSGTNPNGSDEPQAPSTAATTPGIEVTTQEASPADSDPPQTKAPPTVAPPPGPPTDVRSSSAPTSTETTASPGPTTGGKTPFVVGGILVVAALVGTGIGVRHSRRRPTTPHE